MNSSLFNSLTAKYYDYLWSQKNLAPTTVKNYERDLKSLGDFFIKEDISEVHNFDRLQVRSYLAWLSEIGYVRASVVRKLSVLRGFFRWLLMEGYIEVNPIPRATKIKKQKMLPRFLTVEEVFRFIDASARGAREEMSLRDHAIMELIYATGLRVSEVRGLNIDDVKLDSNEVFALGKGSKERMVLMGDQARRAVGAYLYRGRPVLESGDSQDALFLSRNGKRLSVRSIQGRVRKYAKEAGLDDGVHTHTLRHSFATHLLAGGAELRVVQELMGHADPSTTQIYTHVTGAETLESYMSAHPFAIQNTGSGFEYHEEKDHLE